MNLLHRCASVCSVVLALGGCASPVQHLSDQDLCLQRAVATGTQPGGRWKGPAQAEAARRELNCDTPALEAEVVKLQTGGMRVVKPHWLPPQGAGWAVQDCRSKSASLAGYDWIETYTLHDVTERTCLQAYGLGR